MNTQDDYFLASGAKQRNKLATYGRGSRNAPTTHNPFSPQVVLDSDEEIPRVAEKKAISKSRTCGSGAQRGSGRKVGKRFSPAPPLASESKSLFDLPSSDSEDDAYSRFREGSKRRKLGYQATKIAHGVVYDDESLQRHIAAEARRDQENLQPLPQAKRISEPGSTISAAQQTTKNDSNVGIGTQRPKAKAAILSNVAIKTTISPADPVIGEYVKKQPPLSTKTRKQDPIPFSPPSLSLRKVTKVPPIPPTPILHNASLACKVPTVRPKAQAMEENITLKPQVPLARTSLQPLQASSNLLPSNKKLHRTKAALRKRSCTPDITQRIALESTSSTPEAKSRWLAKDRHLNTPSTIGIQGIRLSSPDNVTTIQKRKSPTPTRMLIKKTEPNSASTRPRKRIIDRLYRHSSRSPTQSDEEGKGETDRGSDSASARSSASSPVQLLSNEVAMEKPAVKDIASEDDQDTQQTFKSSQSTYGGPKVTYQHQRSYLAEEMVDEADLFKIPILPDPVIEKSSRRSKATQKIPGLPGLPSLPPSFEIDEDLDDATIGLTRNIHELRQAGGNARLLGGMEAILDDIDPKKDIALSTRRSGLLDLCRNLAQPVSCQAFIDHGLVDQLFAQFDESLDEVTGVLVMSCFGFVLNQQCPIHLLSLINNSRIFEFLGSRLEGIEDFKVVVGKRKSNLSRVMQHDMLNISDMMIISAIWTEGSPPCLTARTLSLHCLEGAVRHLREAGCSVDVVSQHLMSSLVGIAAPAANVFKTSSGLALHIGSFDFRQAISILEYTTTIPQTTGTHEDAWTTDSIEQTSHLLPMLCNQAGDELGKARSLILRLCLNLTNGRGLACEIFSKPEIIRAGITIILSGFRGLHEEEDADLHASLLDNVVLALGLLINLAESSDVARLQFMSEFQGNTTFLDTLLQLFNSNVARASEVIPLPYYL